MWDFVANAVKWSFIHFALSTGRLVIIVWNFFACLRSHWIHLFTTFLINNFPFIIQYYFLSLNSLISCAYGYVALLRLMSLVGFFFGSIIWHLLPYSNLACFRWPRTLIVPLLSIKGLSSVNLLFVRGFPSDNNLHSLL